VKLLGEIISGLYTFLSVGW